MRKDLREAFRSLNTPIVIVIDDIDRLTEEEINLIFRLVKANADFPNLIFLLLFDRKTVETALDKISGEQGAAFLEKIVQVGIDLPPLSSDALSNVLFRGISEALEPLISENDFDRGRFSNLWIPGLSLYFQNLQGSMHFAATCLLQLHFANASRKIIFWKLFLTKLRGFDGALGGHGRPCLDWLVPTRGRQICNMQCTIAPPSVWRTERM
jgi:hypothetical protein